MPRPNRESKKRPSTKPSGGSISPTTPVQPTNGTPQRQGVVRMPVTLAHSVGVIAITSVLAQGPVTKNYLLRVIGAMKFALTRFRENGEDGQTTYIVSLAASTPYCGCEDNKRHRGIECKHMLALRALIAQGKL